MLVVTANLFDVVCLICTDYFLGGKLTMHKGMNFVYGRFSSHLYQYGRVFGHLLFLYLIFAVNKCFVDHCIGNMG